MKNLANYLDELDDTQYESLGSKCKKVAHFGDREYIKANRKASRDEEIAAHGKQIAMRSSIQRSKKTYSRKDKHKGSWN